MAIDVSSIGSPAAAQTQDSAAGARVERDRKAAGAALQAALSPGRSGALLDAVRQSLQDIGINSAASGPKAQDAVRSFVSGLLDELATSPAGAESQTADAARAATRSSRDVAPLPSLAAYQQSEQAPNRLQRDLKVIIAELEAARPPTADTPANVTELGGGAAPPAGAEAPGQVRDDAVVADRRAALRQSFDTMVSALGSSGSEVSLRQFLKNLSDRLATSKASGSVVDTLA
ncbi:MAG: hypothetical protein EBV57_02150 [Betaproteobacteria bacterium]|nr:hypothetical protein [Betaproteobacteria bacterium]